MSFQLGFSFIVPAYNAAATLERCIAHLRAQQVPEALLEIIVVDNGSSDGTAEIARAGADQYILAPDKTIAAVRNCGAAAAKSAILVFVDADCLIPEQFCTVVSELFARRSTVMAGSKTHELPEGSGWVAQTWKIHLDRSQLFETPSWLVTRALAVRAEVFVKVGGFDETIETCEDVSFGHAISEHGEIVSDNRLTPLHLEDSDTLWQFFKKEIWRAKNSSQISWQWIKHNPLLLLSKEGISFVLPFYFLAGTVLSFFGFLSIIRTGSALAFIFASLLVIAPVAILSFDTARRAQRPDALARLALLYTVYISAKVCALFHWSARKAPRRNV